MGNSLGRRELLAGTGAALVVGALESCSINTVGTKRGTPPTPTVRLAPLHASPDRITAITVCTRPFRAQGPRLDVEKVGQKTVIHNYGHGGSGWSLSWGASGIAVQKAVATGASFVPRRDGLVFQAVGEDDYYGFDDGRPRPTVQRRNSPSTPLPGFSRQHDR
jgi:hypothetical protein